MISANNAGFANLEIILGSLQTLESAKEHQPNTLIQMIIANNVDLQN